jgi:hypothetical protein
MPGRSRVRRGVQVTSHLIHGARFPEVFAVAKRCSPIWIGSDVLPLPVSNP